MKTTEKTIQSVAQEMYDNLETATRTAAAGGGKFIRNKEEIAWQKTIIHAAHGDALPDDYIYQFIRDALEVLADSKEGEEDEALYAIEPDVYTSDLTAWLHSSNRRTYYITEVQEEMGPITDGFQLLGAAQQKEKQEVAQLVLEGIRKYLAE